MMLKHAVGSTIRKIRHEQGLTLRQVAKPSFISIGYLSEIERGQKDASSAILESIASCLRIDTLTLVRELYEYLEEHDG
jgi:transcriptional regulator with XRE-family HTH domain